MIGCAHASCMKHFAALAEINTIKSAFATMYASKRNQRQWYPSIHVVSADRAPLHVRLLLIHNIDNVLHCTNWTHIDVILTDSDKMLIQIV